VPSTEQIRPLKDVWLKPRRVFRELAATPIGITDYLLAAAQGAATSVMVYRIQVADPHATTGEILFSSFLLGPLGGVASLYLFAAIYARLGLRAGGKAVRNQVFHVLAYGGVPVAASLVLWALTALLVGEPAIVNTPSSSLDGFVAFVLRVQLGAFLLMVFWSVVLQVMGFSEIWGLETRRSFGVWVLGQMAALLAIVLLSFVIAILFPGIVPSAPN
jgi:hypothetical protein